MLFIAAGTEPSLYSVQHSERHALMRLHTTQAKLCVLCIPDPSQGTLKVIRCMWSSPGPLHLRTIPCQLKLRCDITPVGFSCSASESLNDPGGPGCSLSPDSGALPTSFRRLC